MMFGTLFAILPLNIRVFSAENCSTRPHSVDVEMDNTRDQRH